MTATERVIRWSTAGAVVGVAVVAWYEHAYALVRAHGETGWTPHGLGRLENEQPGLTGGEHGLQAAGCPRAAEHVMDLRGC